MNDESLSIEQKEILRLTICESARKLLGTKYEYGAEWIDLSLPPAALDCSELVENVFRINGLKMPDGSQSQYNFCVHKPEPQMGDLAFFGKGADPAKVYHVGLVLNDSAILEARGFDPTASFETGKVIVRPLQRWANYKNFLGYRTHPKLL